MKIKTSRKKKGVSEKKMFQIAKAVTNRLAELKQSSNVLGTFNLSAPDTSMRCVNIFGQNTLQRGTADNQIIGSAVRVKDVKLRFQMSRIGDTNVLGVFNSPCYVRVSVLATDLQLTTSAALITPNDIYRIDGSQEYTMLGEFDTDKVRVMYDTLINIAPEDIGRLVSTNNTVKELIKTLKFNRKITFKSTPGTLGVYLKEKNYYIVYSYGPTPNVPNYVNVSMNWLISYYDE